ncbi:unnamed protein product, partial [Phaeothamnion confervicola]
SGCNEVKERKGKGNGEIRRNMKLSTRRGSKRPRDEALPSSPRPDSSPHGLGSPRGESSTLSRLRDICDRIKAQSQAPDPQLCTTLVTLAETQPEALRDPAALRVICEILKDSGDKRKHQLQGTTGQQKHEPRPAATAAAAAVVAALRGVREWPLALLEVYMSDALGGRQWVDHPDCRTFVENLQTAWKLPETAIPLPPLPASPPPRPPPPPAAAVASPAEVAAVAARMAAAAASALTTPKPPRRATAAPRPHAPLDPLALLAAAATGSCAGSDDDGSSSSGDEEVIAGTPGVISFAGGGSGGGNDDDSSSGEEEVVEGMTNATPIAGRS